MLVTAVSFSAVGLALIYDMQRETHPPVLLRRGNGGAVCMCVCPVLKTKWRSIYDFHVAPRNGFSPCHTQIQKALLSTTQVVNLGTAILCHSGS